MQTPFLFLDHKETRVLWSDIREAEGLDKGNPPLLPPWDFASQRDTYGRGDTVTAGFDRPVITPFWSVPVCRFSQWFWIRYLSKESATWTLPFFFQGFGEKEQASKSGLPLSCCWQKLYMYCLCFSSKLSSRGSILQSISLGHSKFAGLNWWSWSGMFSSFFQEKFGGNPPPPKPPPCSFDDCFLLQSLNMQRKWSTDCLEGESGNIKGEQTVLDHGREKAPPFQQNQNISFYFIWLVFEHNKNKRWWMRMNVHKAVL